MANDAFRPRSPQPDDENENLTSKPSEENFIPPQAPTEVPQITQNFDGMAIKGRNIPPEFLQAMRRGQGDEIEEPKRGFGSMNKNQEEEPEFQKPVKSYESSNDHVKDIIERLRNVVYDEIELPSKGRFYDGRNGPLNGLLSIRPMTGEEEQILATPRFVRRGQAINMIFQKCIKENQFRPENLLTIDRTFLLIYLRGISYTTKYDVEVKCPDCETKFSTTIPLEQMNVVTCPDDYGPLLQDVMPNSKLPFTYRLSTGKDEQDITDYRDRRVKTFGDSSVDDTLIYRTSMLLHNIDGIEKKSDIQVLLKNLPINDVAYVRNCINEPPFGVDTNIEIVCPGCLHDFEVDLPLEANFFFPRRKKGLNQA